ncbi:MAG: hypothetical protein ACYDDS_09230 [Candidatus Sulfotelmatobacter sp.]
MAGSKVDDRDRLFVNEFYQDLTTALDDISLSVFLCGKGLTTKPSSRRDIRTYLQRMLEAEVKSCRVKLGEHKVLIRTYTTAVGKTATNLADHELALAHKIDLLVIFPSSAGSIAELGMFCLEDTIAQKMAIFLSRRFRRSRSFVVNGPVAAAKRRNSKIFYVDYSDRDKIWKEVRSLVLDIRANKGRARLLKT